MDYYNILGVNRNSSQEEIKQAYRKLAAKHHPDRGGDTKKFQEIQEAYNTLSNLEKKAAYDNPQPQMHGFPGGFHFQTGGFPPGFEEMFEGAFGGMFRRQPQRNRTLNLQTEITLEESFHGKDFVANIRLPSGREQLLEIKIPRGIQDGNTIRLSGMGDDSIPNIQRGDIHLTVHVRPSNEFIRNGDDLIKEIEVNCLDAIVGKTINVKTIEGKNLETNISQGVQHGQFMSIPGHGMPNINNNVMRGRLLLKINIVIPTNLPNEKLEKIKELLC